MWQTSALKYLEECNYSEVVRFYEEIIENEPDEITNYCYLGLAYLLEGKEEEAQITWFTAFSEIDEAEIDNQTQILQQILTTEAHRQLTLNNNQLSWLIRSHLRELNPDNFINFLELICLDIYIHNYDIERFETWKLEESCQGIVADNLPTELLLKALNIIVSLPCVDSLAFVRFCLSKTQDFQLILAEIVNLAIKMVYKNHYVSYGIDLIKICREFDPSNLILLYNLYIFSEIAKNYEQALTTLYKIRDISPSLLEKAFCNSQILKILLKDNQWQTIFTFFSEYLETTYQYLNSSQGIAISHIVPSLPIINQPLLHLQDNPRQNRYLINGIGKIFQQSFTQETTVKVKPYTNTLIKDRPLKIGYVGSTLRSHSVGWLSRWLIHYQDQEKYPCYLYAITNNADETTEKWFKKRASKFYTGDRQIDKIIAQIQQDEIDILVDLDSLTVDLACQIMALKPAPIQITWLGFSASGIPAIDYFIADPYVLPNNAQDYYSEKIWRLPDTYLGIDGFESDVPTLRKEDLDIPDDAIIYLNIQNVLKRHPAIIHLQMKIIKAVPNSYLLIKGNGDQQILKQLFTQIAEEEGIDTNRLRFLERTPTEAIHRANLTIADVILDTYPYNGSTTSLETLWMEIPLVTRVGEQFAARNSYTYMMNAGITEGIAWSDEEYVQWGIRLGTNENLRKEISCKLRQSKKISPLWNGKEFAREMENAYRQMWKIYVKENS